MKANHIILFLRWFGIIPVLLFIYILTNLSFGFTFRLFSPSYINDIEQNDAIPYPVILSILIIFIREAIATALSVFSAAYVIPKKRKIIFIILIVLWVFIMVLIVFFFGISIFALPISLIQNSIWKSLIFLFAQISGLIAAGIMIEKYKP